jgi:magnesium chelatase family protein
MLKPTSRAGDFLSTRAYNHVLKVARTIADIEGSGQFVSDHVSEANQDRGLERRVN